jgi:hypothetical protein
LIGMGSATPACKLRRLRSTQHIPLFYIHHPNFGLYFSHFLYQIGVTSFGTQNALSLIGSLFGLLLGYLFALRSTRSEWFALGFLVLLAANVEFIANWSFNIHRAFTYAAVFGTLYALLRWAEYGFHAWRWCVGSAAACVALIGTDYMFFFWTMFAALTMLALFFNRPTALRGGVVVMALFAAVFGLRQLQVAVGVGPAIWAADFAYQVLNRIGLLSLYPTDWLEQTTKFYQTHRVLNPGFSGSMALHERVYHLLVATGEGLLYGLGDMSPGKRLALILGTLLGSVTALGIYCEWRRGPLSVTTRFGLIFFVPCLIMPLIFPSLFVLWNRAFLLPHLCVAAWIMTALALMLRPTPRHAGSTC